MYAFIAFIEQVVKSSSEDSWQWLAEGGGILWPAHPPDLYVEMDNQLDSIQRYVGRWGNPIKELHRI